MNVRTYFAVSLSVSNGSKPSKVMTDALTAGKRGAHLEKQYIHCTGSQNIHMNLEKKFRENLLYAVE